ncbi:hypothetical protein BGZ83_010833 [Gryganskiella cystojenkinii]|nr:hypothetical protein BGZ83_010833 [Gryganskiella cystojenkinii]
MFRTVLTRGGLSSASLVQRPVQIQSLASIHSSASLRNASNNKNNNNNNNNSSSKDGDDMFGILFAKTNPKDNTSNNTQFTFGKNRSSLYGNNPSSSSTGNPIFPLFGQPTKANTTANPIHLDINHPSEGRSFKVASPASIDQAYRRLRTTINQSNMKRELRLRRTYETGHVRMRREAQEQNKKLFGNMVRKKIELIKLMKMRIDQNYIGTEGGLDNPVPDLVRIMPWKVNREQCSTPLQDIWQK